MVALLPDREIWAEILFGPTNAIKAENGISTLLARSNEKYFPILPHNESSF